MIEKALQKYLQPAHNFVARPPLDYKLAKRLCCIAFLVGIAAIGAASLVAYRQSRTDVQRVLEPCQHPSGNDTNSTDSTCTDITAYPKHIFVQLHAYSSLKVTLSGYLTKAEIQDAIRGMTCQILSLRGATYFYDSHGFTNPVDFRRSCTNRLKPGIIMKPGNDLIYDRVLDIVRTVKRLKEQEPTLGVPFFEITGFHVEKEYIRHPTPQSALRLMGKSASTLATLNHSAYEIQALCDCESKAIEQHIYRKCSYGAPLNSGPTWDSYYHPDTCPVSLDANVTNFYWELDQDPLWQETLIRNASWSSESQSAMSFMACEACENVASTITDFLAEQERLLSQHGRSADEIISSITEQIVKQCPYSFVCTERQFQSYGIWLAIAYPLILFVVKAINFGLRHAYYWLRLILLQASDDERPQQTSSTPDSHRPAVVSDDLTVALENLFGGVDSFVLERIPREMENMQKHILRLETQTAGFNDRIKKLEIPLRKMEQTGQAEDDQDEVSTSAADLNRRMVEFAEEINTSMADLDQRIVELDARMKGISGSNPTSTHSMLRALDANIELLESELDTLKESSGREDKPQSDEQARIAAELSARVKRLENEQKILDVAMWNVQQDVGLFAGKVEHGDMTGLGPNPLGRETAASGSNV